MNVTDLPSTAFVDAVTATNGDPSTSVSASVIVPVAVASPSVACIGFDNVNVNVSFPSATRSRFVSTNTDRPVSPAGNVSKPFVAVKSVPLCAVPLDVLYWTETCRSLLFDSNT
ncbi:MAG: hypothetical protein OXP75_16925 [Rhodospirillales bacterium]|nr:hypothetical protein [Rhodospirillales bacterium]